MDKNIQGAIDGEHWESSSMYPEMIQIATADETAQGKKAKLSFEFARGAEISHEAVYQVCLDKFLQKEDVADEPIYICPVCGYAVFGENPVENCPVCKAPWSKFQRN
jgi:rubrerythrin